MVADCRVCQPCLGPLDELSCAEVDVHHVLGPGGGPVLGSPAEGQPLTGLQTVHLQQNLAAGVQNIPEGHTTLIQHLTNHTNGQRSTTKNILLKQAVKSEMLLYSLQT